MSCVSHYCGTVVLFHSMHLKGLNTETGFLFSIIRSAQWDFLGFGGFFPSKYYLSKSEGAEKHFFSLSINRWLGSGLLPCIFALMSVGFTAV